MSKKLSVFTLAMINVAAVSSVRNWPTIAEYGFASLFFFAVAALLFFIPVSMVSAELATGWPKTGGVFAWVKEAFGHRTGFLAVWLLWAENVIYYPALLSFIAGTIAYIINPALAQNTYYTLFVILGVFWATTLANLLGMRASGWISTFGVIAGTIIPGGLIIILGIAWYFSGNPIEIPMTVDSLIPDMSSPTQLVFFSGVLVALCGLEMSAVHARDVENPQKNYPKAILLSAILVLGLYVLGVLAIAVVIPQKQISLVAGSLQAFSFFVNSYGLSWLTPVIAALLAFGAFGTLSTWIAGPSKGLLGAAQSGDLPPFFRKLNRHGMPVALLVSQGVIVTIFSLIFLVMPTVSSAYWILNAMVAQLYLVMYILMFAAAIKLRYKRPNVVRAYKIPGGKLGIWLVAGLGLIGSAATFFIGFFPPAQIPTGNTVFYVTFLFLSIVLACFAPTIILWFKKPNWSKPLSHEKNS
ncbi:MAG: amino acid permease [Parachlamydiales bacterium]|nr:amino acid permease [Verrucomicrobiota bacterium]MBX3718106.1 amino acid permease [Candidatus Acheromyda pituitae]